MDPSSQNPPRHGSIPGGVKNGAVLRCRLWGLLGLSWRSTRPIATSRPPPTPGTQGFRDLTGSAPRSQGRWCRSPCGRACSNLSSKAPGHPNSRARRRTSAAAGPEFHTDTLLVAGSAHCGTQKIIRGSQRSPEAGTYSFGKQHVLSLHGKDQGIGAAGYENCGWVDWILAREGDGVLTAYCYQGLASGEIFPCRFLRTDGEGAASNSMPW